MPCSQYHGRSLPPGGESKRELAQHHESHLNVLPSSTQPTSLGVVAGPRTLESEEREETNRVIESAFIPFVSFGDLDDNAFKILTSLLSVEQEIQYDEHT
jgi:hypothetical protein